MAKRIPPIEHRFKPGQSGNPGGRKKNLFTSDQLKAAFAKFVIMTREDIEKMVKDPKTNIIDLTIASIFMNAIKHGDSSRFEHLMQRAIGKVKEQVEVAQVQPYVIERLDGTQLELGAEIKDDEYE